MSAARRARSSSRRCRSTIRRCASPTSRARSQILGWEPEVALDEGLRACTPRCRRSRSLLGAPSDRSPRSSRPQPRACRPRAPRASFSTGSSTTRRSIYGNPDQVFPVLKTAAHAADPGQPRLGRRRAALRNAGRRTPADPADPAYDWSAYDRTVNYAAAVRDQGRLLDHRHAAVGERRRRLERRADEDRSTCSGSRPQPRAATAARYRRRRRPHPAAGAQLARLERAEQPRLPAAPVPPRRAASG